MNRQPRTPNYANYDPEAWAADYDARLAAEDAEIARILPVVRGDSLPPVYPAEESMVAPPIEAIPARSGGELIVLAERAGGIAVHEAERSEDLSAVG